jgi:hypothetical protein
VGAAALFFPEGPLAAEHKPREWTFEEAAKHWRPMARAVEHVGIPGYPFQAAVLWDGSLVFGPLGFRELKLMQKEIASLGNNLLHVAVGYGEPMRLIDRRGTRNPAIQRRLEDGRLPIPHVQTQDGGFLWDETVFAALADRRPAEGLQPKADDVLAVCARFQVQNTGRQPGLARLWLHLGETSDVQFGYKCTVAQEPGPAIGHRLEGQFGLVGARVRYVIPPPSQGKLIWHEKLTTCQAVKGPLERVIQWQVPLEPGAKADLLLVIPYGLVDRPVAARLAVLDFDARLGEVREFWQKLLAGRSQISTPDAFINNYAAAVAGQMAEQVAYRRQSHVWMYKDEPQSLRGLLALQRGEGPGSRVTATDMATHFGGRVDLDLTVANDGNSVTAGARLHLAARPKEIRIRLRSPDGRPLGRAEINGQPATVLANDVIQLPPEPVRQYRLVGHYNTPTSQGASR